MSLLKPLELTKSGIASYKQEFGWFQFDGPNLITKEKPEY